MAKNIHTHKDTEDFTRFVYATCPTCWAIPFSCMEAFIDEDEREAAERYESMGFTLSTGALPKDFVDRARLSCRCRPAPRQEEKP